MPDLRASHPNHGAGPRAGGTEAEALVAERLTRAGWTVLGRNLRVGRDEVDILALDPGPPTRLVIVEVRARRARTHGLAEETLTARKRWHLRRAAAALAAAAPSRPGGGAAAIPRCGMPSIDLVVLEPGPAGTRPRVRHHRDVLVDG